MFPPTDKMDDTESLEFLSLVSKVMSEIHNHLNVRDKTLAKFIIHHRTECDSLEAFRKKCREELQAPFPDSLIESIDRLVLTLHPKLKQNGVAKVTETGNNEDGVDKVDEKARMFPGLALPDKEVPLP